MPLRFPRPVMALIAAGTAAVSIGVAAVPAHADQVRHKEWWLTSLSVTGAWASAQGSGVTVAVLSDGVAASQPDLAGAVTAAPAPSGAPVASGQYSGEQGTAIASLIAGRGHGTHGSSGIVGVAPEARILSIPVTLPADDPKLSESTIAAAIPAAIAAGIRYAVRQGATVIDLPIDPGQPGSSGTGGTLAAADGSPAEQSAISYALRRDVVLVAPAGDDGTASDAPNYPAAYHGVIAVGAFNSAFIKAAWSSHRSYVTLTAAGVGMLAAANTGGYQTVDSTSAASAVVSGIVALIRSRYPDMTAQQVRTSLTSSTVYRPADGMAHGSGYGSVNAANAMAAAAMLSTRPADRAGAGAQPPLAPAAVAAPSPTHGFESQLLRAGEISGGLLVLLLVLIALYAATGRRRRGGQPAVTAQWAHRQAQSRYPQAADFVQTGDVARRGDFGQAGDFAQTGAFAEAGGFAHRAGADADRMLEVSTAPVVHADRGIIGQRTGRAALGSRADDGLFAPAARPGGGVSGTEAGARGAEATDSGPWPSHGPASRAVDRRPAVSGTPPWEAAASPGTELPWTAAPGRHSNSDSPAAAALPGPTPSAPPAWQHEPADQSLFRPADRHLPAPAHHDADWDDRGWSPAPAAGPVAGAGSDLWSRNAHRSSDADWSGPTGGSSPEWTRGPTAGSSPDWTGGPDWGSNPGRAGAGSDVEPSWDADDHWPGEPRAAASGLPIRRPRAALPTPLSPSGSLWEPVERDPGDDGQRDSQDPGSRPIYVWNPSSRHSSAPRYQPPPAE